MGLYTLKGLQNFATKMARQITTAPYALGLKGEIGAGKTTFAKAFIHHFDKDTDITSPTFPIVQYYNHGQIAHYDLYRIKHVDEFYTLDILEDLYTKICLIEWPELLNDVLDPPIPTMHISIKDDDKREIQFYS